MVVDKYVGRCLDVGSTPTGSIIPLHSFAKKGVTNRPYFKKGYNICRILEIYVLRKAFSDSSIPLHALVNIGFFVVTSLIGFLIVLYLRNSKC